MAVAGLNEALLAKAGRGQAAAPNEIRADTPCWRLAVAYS